MKKGKAAAFIQNPIINGIVCCLIFTAGFTAAAAGLLRAAILPQGAIRISAAFCVFLATMLACLVNVRKVQSKKLIYAMSICIGFLGLTVLGRLLFLRDSGWDVVPALCSSMIGALCGGIFSASNKKMRKRKAI